ncbi:MAG: branched-chain alpha-keto acid dehydrogenase subunit E2 [Thermoplasmata archaeon]|nr:branched-chain alpha-keto acid dehydrogenase subunit E2 [Thermoplasmata archaeon]|tara:strand:- start:1129 stop:2421 length:1293 start_codon:yes stop_codon:yes gene_type:complete
MGVYAFRLPDIGEGVVEGEVVQWHVTAGNAVNEDDPLIDVMTDKATVTIPSPVTGVIIKTMGEAGEIISVGSVCIEFEVDGEGNSDSVVAPEKEVEKDPAEKPKVMPEPVSKPEPAPEPAPESTQITSSETPQINQNKSNARPLASPAVRRRALEEGVDLSQVNGSGPAGRITHGDLDSHREIGASGGGIVFSATEPPASGTTEIPIVGLRRKISEQMTKSYTQIPHFSYFEEVDVTDLEALRQWINSNRSPEQPKLTYLSFIMKALVKLFRNGHHGCNGHYEDEREVLVLHNAINIGIATTTDRGLYVPVVKNCEAKDIWSLGSELRRVSGSARDGTATLSDLTGSTFTITSLGKDGGLGATPIINTPEVGILGVHKAVDRPVVVDGKITIRKMMNLSSSWDHRVVDGADGAALIQGLKSLLEHPIQIL